MRSEFPKAVRVDALKRCQDAQGNLRCEGCGVLLKGRKYAFDHDLADGLGGKPTLQNCRVLCDDGRDSCHGRKTAEHDVPLIAKTKRVEEKHLRLPRNKPKMQSRGFGQAEPQRRATGKVEKWFGWRE